LLLDWWPLDRLLWQENYSESAVQKQGISAAYQKATLWYLAAEKIPLFLLSAVSGVITFVVQKHSGAVVNLTVWPLYVRIISAMGCYFNYIVKMLYPRGLAALYPLPKGMTMNAAVLAVIGVIVLLKLWGRGRPWLVVGLLWYLGTLVPVIGLVQVGKHLIADRYTYLPSIGIFIIIAWGATEIFAKLSHPKPLAAAAATAALIAMVLLTQAQVSYWQDSPTLCKRALAVTEDNFIMHSNYGEYLCEHGQYEEGIRHLKEAVRICPDYPPARKNICTALLAQKKFDEAIRCLTEVLQEGNNWPDMHQMYNNLGSIYAQKGNLDLAEINFRKALSLKPDYEPARRNLALVLAEQGKMTELQETNTNSQQNR
ncbi:MAG: tetratricopeptide repeat protein, partial [Sedimentisphaerales bacterium]